MSEPYVLEKTKGEKIREEAEKIKSAIDAEIEYCIENGQYRQAVDLINRLRELV